MPAGGPERLVVVPACARSCVYVRFLIEQAAEDHGLLAAQEREMHALGPDDEPEPA